MRNLSSQLYRFLIRQVRQAIKKRRRTKSIRDRQAKRRRTKYKRNLTIRKVENDPGKWGIFFFFETESLVGPRLEGKGI